MDEGMLDGVDAMSKFVNLISSEPEIAKVFFGCATFEPQYTLPALLVGRQRGLVRVADLKSGSPEFKSRSDHQLDLFQVVPGSTSWLHLYIANWSASCQLGFLTCSVHSLNSVALCIVGPHQFVAANYYPTHQIKYYYYHC